MSIPDRLRIVEEIWESIPAKEPILDIPNWHKEILDQRLEELKNNPEGGESWEKVKKEIEILAVVHSSRRAPELG